MGLLERLVGGAGALATGHPAEAIADVVGGSRSGGAPPTAAGGMLSSMLGGGMGGMTSGPRMAGLGLLTGPMGDMVGSALSHVPVLGTVLGGVASIAKPITDTVGGLAGMVPGVGGLAAGALTGMVDRLSGGSHPPPDGPPEGW